MQAEMNAAKWEEFCPLPPQFHGLLHAATRDVSPGMDELRGLTWQVAYVGDFTQSAARPNLATAGMPGPVTHMSLRVIPSASLKSIFSVDVDGARSQTVCFYLDVAGGRGWCMWYLLPAPDGYEEA